MLARAKDSKRQRRSESAEAVTLVLKCIAKYVDLTTFKVGFYQPNSKKWFDLSYNKICEHTGLSLSRVRRALAELQRVGLLALHPISEAVLTSSGELRYYAKPAIKTVNLGLFGLFGLADRAQKERQKAYKRQKRKEEQSRTEEAKNTVKTLLSGSEGLSGVVMAKAVLQAAKYAEVKTKRSKKPPPNTLERDDIPY
ncbi:hypothetical protein K6L10_00080 [Vibrio parahaemolyticus]|uniref:hypothetical protein n=1 Tax=Vibrio parahaemolyticus TaxID=670 RepID=UPI001C92BB8A|nr:hypothetical protein [Vibrio parahaemolyticus]MBY4650573.1 hypothetical protein [Vibrio parahaemolyticus]